jgi:uncharacterized membrane protein YfcA
LTPFVWLQLGLVTFLASTVQGAVGFAFTLLALPFFLLVLGSTEAIQIMLVLNLVVPLCLIRHLWKDVPRDLWRLLLTGAVVGLPLGMIGFAFASLETVKLVVGVVVIAFAGVIIFQRFRPRGERSSSPPMSFAENHSLDPGSGDSTKATYRRPSVLFVGVAAGAMTSALGMPGPAMVLYLTGIGVSKTAFRALSLSLFVVLYVVALLLQSVTVGVPPRVWISAAALVPLAGVGALAGHALAEKIGEATFLQLVLLLLLGTGTYMLITTLTN